MRRASLVVSLSLLVLAGCGHDGPTGPSSIEADREPTARQTWIIWGTSNALGCGEGPGHVGTPDVTAWDPAAQGWVPAREVLPFMTPADYCTSLGGSGWAVLAANLHGGTVRLTGHAEGARRIAHWSENTSRLTRHLTDAKDATWLISYEGESEAYHDDTFWAEEFRVVVEAARAATNPQMRVLVIGLADEPINRRRGSYAAIRAQQKAYVASDPLAVYMSAEGVEAQPYPNAIHLSRRGYEQLAVRVAAAIRAAR